MIRYGKSKSHANPGFQLWVRRVVAIPRSSFWQMASTIMPASSAISRTAAGLAMCTSHDSSLLVKLESERLEQRFSNRSIPVR